MHPRTHTTHAGGWGCAHAHKMTQTQTKAVAQMGIGLRDQLSRRTQARPSASPPVSESGVCELLMSQPECRLPELAPGTRQRARAARESSAPARGRLPSPRLRRPVSLRRAYRRLPAGRSRSPRAPCAPCRAGSQAALAGPPAHPRPSSWPPRTTAVAAAARRRRGRAAAAARRRSQRRPSRSGLRGRAAAAGRRRAEGEAAGPGD
mmetsp:Transcript_12754/g.42384  ORF Transcript_12754/g.42384 Transcript_12754/m.42384 type:complete len:206 (+) Transcript_12754:309-926(+)